MTYSFVGMLIGLVVWLVFTKWQKVADGWVAELGKIVFAFSFLAWIWVVGVKVVF